MDTQNTPYSIKKPGNWDLISAYSTGGPKPDSVTAEKILNEFLGNIKIANCDYFEDVCNAILTRIPGKIEAENYGHQGFNRSYFVLDSTRRSAFYRKNEPVQIRLDSKDDGRFRSEQSIELQKSEWVVYDFKSLDNKKHQLTMRASAGVVPAGVSIWINNKKVDLVVKSKEPVELTIGEFNLKTGDNKIKFLATSDILILDWIRVD